MDRHLRPVFTQHLLAERVQLYKLHGLEAADPPRRQREPTDAAETVEKPKHRFLAYLQS